MIGDARKVADGTVIDADVCVVGAGAAGITAALELARAGRSVVLLEAGGRHRAGRSQDLYRGTLADPELHLPLDKDRYRQLGGTTSLWGGRCLPFDPIDFEARPYVPLSGWPIGAADVEPFYPRAHAWLECGRYAYDSRTALPGAARDMIGGFRDGELVTTSIERWSPPTHFGKRYASDLESTPNLRVFLHAVAVSLDVGADGRRVETVTVAGFRRGRFRVRAARVVLAGGGFECTRLLMASNRVHRAGIGNASDWLGRCYMCHLSGVVARVKFAPGVPVIYAYEKDPDDVYVRRRFWVAPGAQRAHGLLNTHVLLDRPLVADPEHGSGVLSLAFLAKHLAQGKRHILPGRGKYGIYWSHALNILKGSPEIMSFLPMFCRDRFLQGRRVPSLLLRSRSNSYHLYYHSEQVPLRENRVTLSTERDALGMPRLHLDYRLAESDVESIYGVHELIDRELRRAGCGELVFNEADPREAIRRHQAVLGHHVGTTRMAADPARGVVDADCRVHGIDNLYVASSSVFPTSGQANPTLLLVALALRLCDHLRGRPA